MARWSGERYALDKRFVQLTLLLDQGKMRQGLAGNAAARRCDLGEVLARVPEPAVVVLGPRGPARARCCGIMISDCARQALAGQAEADLSQAPVTFFVSLADYKPASANASLPTPQDWLAAQWATLPELPGLDVLLRQRRLTLLLDALNEIPWSGWKPCSSGKSFCVSSNVTFRGIGRCSPAAIWITASPCRRRNSVPQVRIEPLSNAQVQEFVTVYCPEHGATLWQNLQGTPQLDLLRSPYYLKLLVAQTTTGRFRLAGRRCSPASCGRHYGAKWRVITRCFGPMPCCTCATCNASSRGAPWPPYELPERGILFQKLSALAFQMQSQREANEAAQVRIPYDEALALLAHPRAEDILKAGAALGVEEDRGRDEVLYVHQLLQEYFAARQLARQPQAALVQQEWRAERVVPSLQATLHDLCRPAAATYPARVGRKPPCWPRPWPAILIVSSPI